MTTLRLARIALGALLAIGLASGCAKSPKKLLDKAKKSIGDLSLAKKCAPEAYRSAMKMYQEALEFNKKKAYKEAKRAAEAAIKLAEKARAQAEANKKDCEKIAAADKIGDKAPKENPGELPGLGKDSSGTELPPLATGPPRGPVIEQVIVYFGYNKYSIEPEGSRRVTEFVNGLKGKTYKSIEVEGHCDARGSVEYNLALGERRAKAVRQFLVTQGVALDKVTIISYGAEKPAVDGSTEEAYSKNRRAVIKLR